MKRELESDNNKKKITIKPFRRHNIPFDADITWNKIKTTIHHILNGGMYYSGEEIYRNLIQFPMIQPLGK